MEGEDKILVDRKVARSALKALITAKSIIVQAARDKTTPQGACASDTIFHITLGSLAKAEEEFRKELFS